MAKTLTEQALQEAARELNVELAAVKAVAEVESRGDGFTADGHVKILFERHKFHQFTRGKYDDKYPDISNPKAGGYGKGSQYARFSRAFELDPDAAMKSASWGKFQIMGFNHEAAGFETVGEFVDAMKAGEDEQLRAFVNVIKSWGLAPELRHHDWAAFARQYNGADYKKNDYDTKLADAYAEFRKEPQPMPEPTSPIPVPPPPIVDTKPVQAPVERVPTDPPSVQVPTPKGSISSKIAAATAAVTPILTATGLKIGGIQFSGVGVIALCFLIAVGVVVAGVLWDRDRQRQFERQKLSINNLADRDRNNVVAKSE